MPARSLLRRLPLLLVMLGTVSAAAPASRSTASPREGPDEPTVTDMYAVAGGDATSLALRHEGFDVVRGERGSGSVAWIVLSPAERNALLSRGFAVSPVIGTDGLSSAERAIRQAEQGFDVWRSWDEPGGIRDEMRSMAEEHPDLVALRELGTSVQDREILALKVTAGANEVTDGDRPAVLYHSMQHAREWITVEVTRRLLHHFVDGYGSDAEITEMLNTRELWFLLVSNPDGYQISFDPDLRLSRSSSLS